MGRRAVDTRKYNKIGTRRMFGRILLVFLLVIVATVTLVGRILYLNKNKGNAYEKKHCPSRAIGAMKLITRGATSQTVMEISLL